MSKESFKILIVDDEPDILEFLQYNLEKEGYDVRLANNGNEALVLVKQEVPDLIVLDIMMPLMDGIICCKAIRELPNCHSTIITFLTARQEDYIQIDGLEAGGDDFMNKPIRIPVFLSKIKSLLRRKDNEEGNKDGEWVLTFGDLKIDKSQYVVKKGDDEIKLPKKQFELLLLLSSKPGNVFRREDILSSIWGSDIFISDRTIDVHIRKLREKIGDDFFQTVKGVGYKFIVE